MEKYLHPPVHLHGVVLSKVQGQFYHIQINYHIYIFCYFVYVIGFGVHLLQIWSSCCKANHTWQSQKLFSLVFH